MPGHQALVRQMRREGSRQVRARQTTPPEHARLGRQGSCVGREQVRKVTPATEEPPRLKATFYLSPGSPDPLEELRHKG